MRARFSRLVNFLSVDVALGACAGMYFFARLLRVELDLAVYLLMAVSVWVIYTFDHLLDARFIPAERASPRHRFHQVYFRSLLVGLVAAAIGAILGGLFVLSPTKQFATGMGLASLIGVSLLGTQFFREKLAPYKEVSIALFYVVGIQFLPIFRKDYLYLNYQWIAFACGYVLLAWYNLVFLSLLDYKSDSLSGQRSLVTTLGHRAAVRLLQWVGIVGLVYFLAMLFLLPSYYHVFTAVLMLMFSWHVRYLLEYRQFPRETLRRRLEWSFLMPFALVILPL